VPDFIDDKLYLWMDTERHDYITYFSIVFGSFIVGGFVGGFGRPQPFDYHNALCFLVWIGLLHRVALLHAFGLINSVCHLWGTRPYEGRGTDRTSRNNLLVSLVIFGEGWHNNHHAYPHSARQGFEWYQFDPSWYVIWLLQKLGLATNVKLPMSRENRKYLCAPQNSGTESRTSDSARRSRDARKTGIE
jgi:fatty-acid desaturase